MSTPQVRIAIGLGSNLGERERQLVAAVRALGAVVTEIKVGGLYESEPMGEGDQPRYLNSALVGRTRLSSEPLLAVLKFLELRAGRRRGPRWGSRPLDLDLLLYGDEISTTPYLTLPHPQLTRRAFVLAPLADIAPDLVVPTKGRSVSTLLAAVETDGLDRLDWTEPQLSKDEDGCYPPPRD